uniref:Uncharacterized protein n=1 Tax=Oryza punctata TaxID=4537 RepID=A0A0E0JI13_ORYPU
MARGRDDQQLLIRGLLLLLLLISCFFVHIAAAIDSDDFVVTATVDRGQRLLPASALQPQSVQAKVTAHPLSMKRRTRRSAATMMAVSKHQVPTGANPDSN